MCLAMAAAGTGAVSARSIMNSEGITRFSGCYSAVNRGSTSDSCNGRCRVGTVIYSPYFHYRSHNSPHGKFKSHCSNYLQYISSQLLTGRPTADADKTMPTGRDDADGMADAKKRPTMAVQVLSLPMPLRMPTMVVQVRCRCHCGCRPWWSRSDVDAIVDADHDGPGPR